MLYLQPPFVIVYPTLKTLGTKKTTRCKGRTDIRSRFPRCAVSGQWKKSWVREVGKKDLKLWEKDWLRRCFGTKSFRFWFALCKRSATADRLTFFSGETKHFSGCPNPSLNCFILTGIRLY